MDWNLRYATVGESGIDYSKASPCTKGKKCGFCKHLDKIEAGNKDETGKSVDQDHAETIKRVRKMHQGSIGSLKKEQNNA
jgi:hypothetical protein